MIIVEMKKHFELRAVEWFGAGAMTSLGFFILLNPSMFSENPAAHGLLVYAPQHIWGLVSLVAGALRLVALFVNGMWYRTPAVRWLTTMISIFVWFCLAAAYLASPVPTTASILLVWHIVADMYSAYRAATDFIEAEAQRELKRLSALPHPSPNMELEALAASIGEGDNVRRFKPR
jgi:hypothetical protein